MATERLHQLEELLKESPNDPFLHYGIALELVREGKRAEAILRIEKLLAENPDYLGAYYQLGQMLEQENEIEKAKAVYEKGVLLAAKQRNFKTAGEMKTAMDNLE